MTSSVPDELVEWGLTNAADLVTLCAAALPGESLGVDDLESVCLVVPTHDAGDVLKMVDVITLATADGTGAVTVSLTGVGEHRSAHLQLLVVHPSHRRRGVASALVAGAERWASARGVTELTVGGAAPFYLFTGVDSRWTAALCLFESLGYERCGAELDLVCTTRPVRSPIGRGVEPPSGGPAAPAVVEAVATDAQVADLMVMVERDWPLWASEFRRAAAAGTVVIARDGADGAVLGAAAHSVSRFGVIGPVAVDPRAHGRGIGSSMMRAVLADLSVAGLTTAEIAWTSTVRFYVESCGASVGRTSVLMRRTLDPLAADALVAP